MSASGGAASAARPEGASKMITSWKRQIARIYDVPLWLLVPGGWHWRRIHTDYSRRLRARRRRARR